MNTIKEIIFHKGPACYFMDHVVDSAKQTRHAAQSVAVESDATSDKLSRCHKLLNKIGGVVLNGLKTTGFAGLMLVSIAASIPCGAAVLGHRIGKLLCKEPNLKRPLEVKVFAHTPESTIRVTEIMNIWQQVAKEKKAAGAAESTIFSNNSYIAGRITTHVNERRLDLSTRILVCYDKRFKTPQAVAVVENATDSNKQTSKYIHSLVTNPINIRSDVNNKERKRVTGAATALIAKIGSLCLEESIEMITLSSLPSALSFYAKTGFTPVNQYFNEDYLMLSKDNFPKCKQLKN